MTLIMSKEQAKEKGLKPLATVRHAATVGVDPTIMGIGPAPATQKLLKRTGMDMDDFDLIEINEAFACQVLAVGEELKWDWDRVNPNGGAVAIGHPLGRQRRAAGGDDRLRDEPPGCRMGPRHAVHGRGDGDVRGATARELRLVGASRPANERNRRRAKRPGCMRPGFLICLYECGVLARSVLKRRQ